MVLVNEDYFHMLTKYGDDSKCKADGGTAGESSPDQTIIASLPKTFQPKGQALLSFLRANEIGYDESQRVTVKGDPIEGSNFLDVLHDLLRYRDVPPPKGFTELAPVLKKLNISREFVPNLERYRYITQLEAPPLSTGNEKALDAGNDVREGPPLTHTPQVADRKMRYNKTGEIVGKRPRPRWAHW